MLKVLQANSSVPFYTGEEDLGENICKFVAFVRLSFQISPVITGDPNCFLSVSSKGLLLGPKCGKMSMNVHHFHLKP